MNGTIRKLTAAVALTLVTILGCGATEVAPTMRPLVARRSDPQPYLPPATREPLRSVATIGLYATVAEDDVRASALSFIRAWVTEDIDALMDLISDDFSLGSGGRTISRQVLREAWIRQFARLDFTQLTIDEVVDQERIEVIPYEEHGHIRMPAQGVLRTGDLLVRLRMLVTQRNRRRYFDDVVELWFRRNQGCWEIVALGD